MRRFVQILPAWLLELIPIVLGLAVGYLYFLWVLPEARAYGARYVLAFALIFAMTRVPKVLLSRRYLAPAMEKYLASKREKRRLSRGQLQPLFVDLAAYVPRAQMISFSLWIGAFLLLAAADRVWMVGTKLSFLGLLFGILLVACIALALNYFLLKERLRPILEDVLSQMEKPPDVSRWRISFRVKMIGFVASLVALAMLCFGLLLYALMHRSAEEIALGGGAKLMAEFAQQAEAAQGTEALNEVAYRLSSPNAVAFVTDAQGVPLTTCSTTCHGGADSPSNALAQEHLARVASGVPALGPLEGVGRIYPVRGDQALVQALSRGRAVAIILHPRALNLLMHPVLRGGVLFLTVTLLALTGYLWLIGHEQSKVLARMGAFSGRIARGDLRRPENIWNDDELGLVAENLNVTFLALRRMVGQAREAAASVEQEAAVSYASVANLRQEARDQVSLSAETAKGVAGVAGGVRAVSEAMEAVSSSTQDVSTTILEMQASVDELASNAEALSQSVEESVSSSNEIASSSQQVSESTLALKSAAQESVSFFSQLDAALEETRHNAEALKKVSERVTVDAEGGFSSVAAVEEEILHILRATEKSRDASERLQAAMERIGRIVAMIQEVTEQTNLLALNASIIAAGAGEHGKAFGVVASQVRELSGRTANQAAEIRGVVRTLLESGREMADSISQTERVVETSAALSHKAGESLRTILESASSQEEMSRRIAAAMEELSQGGHASRRNFHRIYEMAEGIQGAAAEQARATRHLNREAETVRGVADLMRNATQEQARGGRLIADAVTRITSDSSEVAQASAMQREDATIIDGAVARLSEAAQRTGATVEQLAETVEKLQRASEALGEEIRQFSL